MTVTIIENHPFSKLARQIDQYLWASVILATCIAAVSLINMGRLSLFIVPILFMFTLAHNFTLLSLASRDRKKPSGALENTLAPTASKVNIIACWALAALWSFSILVIIITSVIILSSNQYEAWERLAGYVELPMVVAEVVLMVVIGIKCKTQRKRTMIEPPPVNWQNYGGPPAYPPRRELVIEIGIIRRTYAWNYLYNSLPSI